MKPVDVKGHIAVVTGGGSGIGEATAKLFGSEGATVHVVDLDGTAAERTAAVIVDAGGQAIAHAADVADADAVQRTFGAVVEASKRIDALVNSAGIAHIGTLLSTEESDLDRVYRVNVKGTFLTCRAAVKTMIAQGGGAIVNLASIASLIGIEDRFAYSVSKGAVLTLTRSIAVDYMNQGIRCNCICPARVHTPFVDGFLAKNYPGREVEMFEKLSQYQPIGRMARPAEVAALALYLCSEAASFVTGQALPMDGGVLVK
jgi:NAD(P)-dependent dehydrogenase (short-subunit alcohol dehydrogenase family)